MDRKLNSAFWALRIGLGVAAFAAGLDKFFNLLTNWRGYLSPAFERLMPIDGGTFMHVAGVIEMAVGIAILAGATRIAAYVASVWLLCIAINLLSTGHFLDVAVRDIVMSIGAYTLARLAEVRAVATARQPQPASPSLQKATAHA